MIVLSGGRVPFPPARAPEAEEHNGEHGQNRTSANADTKSDHEMHLRFAAFGVGIVWRLCPHGTGRPGVGL